MTIGCMANRQIARAIGAAHSTIQLHLSRLGRHCILYHANMIRDCPARGPIVIDGFESFELSQYYPFSHNLAVEVDTGFFLYHNDSPLRRKGSMTVFQKKRRQDLENRFGRPDPKAVRKGIRELLSVITAGRRSLTIRSDDQRSYPQAMREVDCRFWHEVTSSRERRTKDNPLWEVNLLDLLIRHGTAAHKRETIAWAKRRQGSAERLSILMVWRNVIKRRWENGPAETPAMLKGLQRRILRVRDVLRKRLFRARIDLSESWARYYDRNVKTAALEVNREHTLSYGY